MGNPGVRPYQPERAKSPMGKLSDTKQDNSVLIPRKHGTNIYSDNGFIRNHNNF